MKIELLGILVIMAKVLPGILGLWLAILFADLSTNFDDNSQVEQSSNLAVGLRKGAVLLAFGLGYTGILLSTSGGFVDLLVSIALETVVMLVLLGITHFVVSAVIMSTIDNGRELERGNTAVGMVEAGSFLAIGLVLRASFMGEGGGTLSAILFTLLGLIALLVLYWGYELMTRWNVQSELKKGNISAGITVAAQMVALAIILHRSIAGPFTGWWSDITSFGLSAVLGSIVLLAAIWFADKVFLPHTTCDVEICRDNNTAAMVLVCGAVISIAVIVAGAI